MHIDIDLTSAAWAAVGGIFAAVAAGASWASVWQNRRDRLAAQRPSMTIEISEHYPSSKIMVQLHNSGAVARGVRFAVIEGDMIAYGAPHPTGIFQEGESRTIETALKPGFDNTARGYVGYVDAAGKYIYAQPTNGKVKKYRLKWPRRKMSDERIIRELFGGFEMKQGNVADHQTIHRDL